MKKPDTMLPYGTKIRTNATLGPALTRVSGPALTNRRPALKGWIRGLSNAYDGDVYYVEHVGMTCFAAYHVSEFEGFVPSTDVERVVDDLEGLKLEAEQRSNDLSIPVEQRAHWAGRWTAYDEALKRVAKL